MRTACRFVLPAVLFLAAFAQAQGQAGVVLSQDPEPGTKGSAGFIWYLQFLTATMADKYIAKQYSFLKATLLMSSAIIFSTILGIFLHEWRGCSARTKQILAVGLILLVAAACILGYSNYLGSQT